MFQDVNGTRFNVTYSTGSELIPSWVLNGYLISVCAVGALLNIAIFVRLLRIKRNGVISVILQLTIADILALTIVAAIENWSRNIGSWNFGPELCVIYLGFEVFSSNASVYFLAVFALHVLASANLQDKNRKSETSLEDEEIQTSLHSLVTRDDSPSPPRTLSIDYRRKRRYIPIILPAMLVWFLAASLCVPEFASATTICLKSGPILCTFVDTKGQNNVHVLLTIFGMLIPATILLSASALTVHRIRKNDGRRNRNETKATSSRRDLHLSLFLCVCYFVLSLPRSALNAAHMIATDDDVTEAESFRRPPLFSAAASPTLALAASLAYFSSCLVRPCLYLYFLPELRSLFTFLWKHSNNREINV